MSPVSGMQGGGPSTPLGRSPTPHGPSTPSTPHGPPSTHGPPTPLGGPPTPQGPMTGHLATSSASMGSQPSPAGHPSNPGLNKIGGVGPPGGPVGGTGGVSQPPSSNAQGNTNGSNILSRNKMLAQLLQDPPKVLFFSSLINFFMTYFIYFFSFN